MFEPGYLLSSKPIAYVSLSAPTTSALRSMKCLKLFIKKILFRYKNFIVNLHFSIANKDNIVDKNNTILEYAIVEIKYVLVEHIKKVTIKTNNSIKFKLLYDRKYSLTKKIKIEQYRSK